MPITRVQETTGSEDKNGPIREKIGKTKGWIGFPVSGEGTTDDIVVTSSEIGMGNSKFCFSLRTADVFPVVSLSLRRERSNDRKYARLQLAGYLCLRS